MTVAVNGGGMVLAGRHGGNLLPLFAETRNGVAGAELARGGRRVIQFE
jgi:hypothetical protein